MKRVLWIALGIALTTQVWTPALAAKQVFNFRIHSEPPTLDWTLATDNVSITLIDNLMEGLAEYDDKLIPRAGLAKSWTVSKDGKTYTYKLRDGVTWSDGVPLTAQHFADSWERLLNPKTASEYAYFLYDVVGAQDYNEGKNKDITKVGFKAIDKSTFEVKLNKAASYFAYIPTFVVTFPIRLDLIQKFGDGWTKPGNMQTVGPFILKDWKHDSKVVLAPNPKYHGGKSTLEEVNAYIINEDTTAINMFESGTLHYVSRLPSLEIDRLKKSPAFRSNPFLRGYYYGFNVTKKPFDNVKVRQAFSLAIDRKQITDILKGGQTPSASWVPKGMPGFEADVGLKYDPKRAQKLLAEAGYPGGKGFPETTFMFDTRDDNKLIAEKIQSMWREVLGVKIRTQNEDWKVYLNTLKTDAPGIYRLGWGADYPDPDNFLNLFTSYSGNNYTRWKSKEYDGIIEKAAAEQAMPKRLALYKKAQVLLLEKDTAIIPLFIDSINMLVSPKVSGIRINAMDKIGLSKIVIQ
jgi:oligopeptide transport system substrate-binding protein